MKKATYIMGAMIAAIMTVATFSACTIESSDAGDYEGMWHLTRVDTIATGGVFDLSRQKIYWSFQFKLMEGRDKSAKERAILMRFSSGGGKLVLNSPYAYNREEGDEPLSDITLLKPYGINKTEEEFQVLSISGSNMKLQSEMLVLSFKKF